jgi:hypothetical protein
VITSGFSLMICTALPLTGLLMELHSRAIRTFHGRVMDDALSPAVTWVTRRHLTRPCATCSMAVEMAVSHNYR